ncbi:hypothetical protein GCM10010306_029190 [Streptomyces umbrinus]|nr:hypothetical protein GCM10010306_029190 [Streptomyces umbrinus]
MGGECAAYAAATGDGVAAAGIAFSRPRRPYPFPSLAQGLRPRTPAPQTPESWREVAAGWVGIGLNGLVLKRRTGWGVWGLAGWDACG